MNDKVERKEVWNPDAYRIRIKLGEDEFMFQSPDRATFEEIGLDLLKKTFGRYSDLE